MKFWSFIIVILIGFSWMTSLAEGMRCDDEHDQHLLSGDDGHHAEVDPSAQDHDISHVCHAGSCHFGHCSHLVSRNSTSLPLFSIASPDRSSTPYHLQLIHGYRAPPLRPPLSS